MQEKRQDISPIKGRILQYIDCKNITEYAFYRDSKITRGILRQRNGISEENLFKFVAYAQDLSPSWILTGKGNMFVTNDEAGESENAAAKCSSKNAAAKYKMQQQNAAAILSDSPVEYNRRNDSQNVFTAKETEGPTGIPLIPITAIAGPGAVVFEDLQVEQYYVIPELKTAEFMVRMKGNSMYPKYSSGDILACVKVLNLSFFQWNKVYAIYTESQGVMIKRIHPGAGDNTLKLVSDNPSYPPFEVPKEEIKAVALVVGCVRIE